MIYSLNKKVTKRHKYYFSEKLNIKPNFYFSKNHLMLALIICLSLTAIFVGKMFIYNSYTPVHKDRNKIQNLVFALDDIYASKHFSEKELTELADYVIKNSKTYNIEPELILAIISVESSFNKVAISKKGARGLMQIMPNTFSEAAKELGIKTSGEKSLYDIESNIRIGTYYLAKLNKKYNNDIKLSLTAYNRGPKSLDTKLKNNETVSFAYFNKVMENYKKFTL